MCEHESFYSVKRANQATDGDEWVAVQFEPVELHRGERFLASARNDDKNGGTVISNPSAALRMNSVKDLSLTEPLQDSYRSICFCGESRKPGFFGSASK
jgi:hypothetical protein